MQKVQLIENFTALIIRNHNLLENLLQSDEDDKPQSENSILSSTNLQQPKQAMEEIEVQQNETEENEILENVEILEILHPEPEIEPIVIKSHNSRSAEDYPEWVAQYFNKFHINLFQCHLLSLQQKVPHLRQTVH